MSCAYGKLLLLFRSTSRGHNEPIAYVRIGSGVPGGIPRNSLLMPDARDFTLFLDRLSQGNVSTVFVFRSNHPVITLKSHYFFRWPVVKHECTGDLIMPALTAAIE